ncbi:MAG: hypothetical protein A2044_04955 [Candidatus Firestonebacteria bacterium GWA2_43_8]|nr:MAG: hypothetical protein A2044_04955 [Candidatus Firestonebacteria bacterium GWA2_43_8]
MGEMDLRKRTKLFALSIIKFSELLPKTRAADVLAKQLIRSATSVGANYLAARSGKSRADFACKLKTSEEEIIESKYWLELLIESEIAKQEHVKDILKEANELSAIFIASSKTIRTR